MCGDPVEKLTLSASANEPRRPDAIDAARKVDASQQTLIRLAGLRHHPAIVLL
jgi:hypothetical protein